MVAWLSRLWHSRRDRHLATLRFAVDAGIQEHTPPQILAGVWRDQLHCVRVEQWRDQRGEKVLRVWIKADEGITPPPLLAEDMREGLERAGWGRVEVMVT